MIYELYDTLDNRTIRVWSSRKVFEEWLSRHGNHWLSRGYSYRQRWI